MFYPEHENSMHGIILQYSNSGILGDQRRLFLFQLSLSLSQISYFPSIYWYVTE